MEDDGHSQVVASLKRRIEELELENNRLRATMEDEESLGNSDNKTAETHNQNEGLSKDQVERYCRQLLLDNGFGVEGQRKLLRAKVLVIGAGGIGSTVIPYLAAAGVGRLTVVDFDQVDLSNLHRQVIHNSHRVGMNKAVSACRAVRSLNPTIMCEAVQTPLTTANALGMVSKHDCVVDASDNPRTRHTINDACVLGGVPLVSGSAMGLEGQFTVYNYRGGACYRCLYPKTNASEGCKTCSDNGVLGPVPGIIGILQAVETLKVLTGFGDVMWDKLTMYDALDNKFLRIKKPPKQQKCPVCGPDATIKSMSDSDSASGSVRGPSCPVDGVSNESVPEIDGGLEISVEQYDQIRKSGTPHVLMDVRVKEQFSMCSLDGAVNIPLGDWKDELDRIEVLSNGELPIYCICRRGIASAAATKMLSNARIVAHPGILEVKNIRGGLNAWRARVDPDFPKY